MNTDRVQRHPSETRWLTRLLRFEEPQPPCDTAGHIASNGTAHAFGGLQECHYPTWELVSANLLEGDQTIRHGEVGDNGCGDIIFA